MNLKKCKVVMLPTNEKASIAFNNAHDWLYPCSPSNLYSTNHQHLYILSDDEIKEGDYHYIPTILSLGTKPCVELVTKEVLTLLKENKYGFTKLCKKIIATTDERLIEDARMLDIPKYIGFPSKSFIQKYVEEYNKGNQITDVLVEYEISDSYRELGGHYAIYSPKINLKDNTIKIKKVKDSWNREEVIELLHKRMKYTFGLDYDESTTNNWIKENL